MKEKKNLKFNIQKRLKLRMTNQNNEEELIDNSKIDITTPSKNNYDPSKNNNNMLINNNNMIINNNNMLINNNNMNCISLAANKNNPLMVQYINPTNNLSYSFNQGIYIHILI